jgi:hypothetical protein
MLSDHIDPRATGLLDSYFPGYGKLGGKLWNELLSKTCNSFINDLSTHVAGVPMPATLALDDTPHVYTDIPVTFFFRVAQKIDELGTGFNDVQKGGVYLAACNTLMNWGKLLISERLHNHRVALIKKQHYNQVTADVVINNVLKKIDNAEES